MQVAIIPPISLLRRYGHLTGYHLCLTHLVEESETYANYYWERSNVGDYIMMDNSVIELGEPVELVRVLTAAKRVQAHEIILPDRLNDRVGTLRLLKHDIEQLDWLLNMPALYGYHPDVQAAPQGDTLEDWFACLEEMMPYVAENKIHTIGVPRCTNDLLDADRAQVLERMDRLFGGKPPFEVHLLGLSDNVTELIEYRDRYPWIRGVDSKLPIRCGVNYVGLHRERGLLLYNKQGLPPLDMYMDIDDDFHPAICLHNIDVMQEFAGHHPKAEIIQWPAN